MRCREEKRGGEGGVMWGDAALMRCYHFNILSMCRIYHRTVDSHLPFFMLVKPNHEFRDCADT